MGKDERTFSQALDAFVRGTVGLLPEDECWVEVNSEVKRARQRLDELVPVQVPSSVHTAEVDGPSLDKLIEQCVGLPEHCGTIPQKRDLFKEYTRARSALLNELRLKGLSLGTTALVTSLDVDCVQNFWKLQESGMDLCLEDHTDESTS